MQLSLWQIILLAIVQGVAEFLPISSSGHLVIVAAFLTSVSGGEQPTALDVTDINIVLHVGTLLSILVFYWWRVVGLLSEDRRVIGLLVVATVPVAIVGPIVEMLCEEILSNPILAASMLLVTAALLLTVNWCRSNNETYQRMSHRKAFLIGIAQATALLPGISRSGSTITAGLHLGLSRTSAATFSFLLAIPAIAGAATLKLIKELASESEYTTPISHLTIGAFVAFVVGMLSLGLLVKWLEQGRLYWFSVWCFVVGIGMLAWQLWPSSQ